MRYRKLSERLNDILKTLGEQWNEIIAQLQQIIDELRSGQAPDADTPDDLPDHCAPFLRTVLDVVGVNGVPSPAELVRLRDVTVELVELLVAELQDHRDLWRPHKRAAQEALGAALFEHLMRLRPPLVDADRAEVLVTRLMDQARANDDRLRQL